MIRKVPHSLRGVLAAIAVAAALPLAGCDAPWGNADQATTGTLPELPATLPLALGEPELRGFAPAADELPYAQPIEAVRVADPNQFYAYADDAWGYAEALGDAPPDYGFEYDDVEPWAWQGYDDSRMYMEPLKDGYRAYYYRPGEDEPYFIRDPDYGYGYDDGRLAVVYADDGGILPYQYYGPRLVYASRYYERGRRLHRAAHRRHSVNASSWLGRRQVIAAGRSAWGHAHRRQPAWQAYHDRNADRQEGYWREERARRRADSVRFTSWREQDFRTPPPPRAIPVTWAKADWARDERRFAPPARGFNGDAAARQRAAQQERIRLASLNRRAAEERRDQRRLALEQRREARLDQRELRQSGRERPAVQRIERQDGTTAIRGDSVRGAVQARRAQAVAQQQRVREMRRLAQAVPANNGAVAEARNRAQVERASRRQVQVADRQQAQAQRRAEAQQRRIAARTRPAQADQTQFRARDEQRQQVQVRAREEAQRRQQAQREQAQARLAARAQEREQAQQREQVQAQQRERVQAKSRQDAQQRQQAQREQAQARSAARAQEREQAQQQRQQQARAAAEQRQQAQANERSRAEQRQQAQAAARAEAQQRQQARAQADAQAEQGRQAQANARASAQQRQQEREQARVARQAAREERTAQRATEQPRERPARERRQR